ncbi:unnamed protein product [Sphagnum balticum]
MLYKQFYNLYGKEYGHKEGTFARKDHAPLLSSEPVTQLKPEYIEINYQPNQQKLKGAARTFAVVEGGNQKELTALK